MKATLLAILFAAAAGSSNAGSLAMPGGLVFNVTGASTAPILEAANRSGSRRVGGSRSGKGSHYVGGRRR